MPGPSTTLHPARPARREGKPGLYPACSQSCWWSWLSSPARDFAGGHRPTTPHRPRKQHTDRRVSAHAARCGSAPAERSARRPSQALPSSTSPVPKPQGSRAPGGAGGGAGCRAALAQKAESGGAGARSESVVPTAPRRKPARTPTLTSPSFAPGLARPRAMEFLWAPLLGLFYSLAAADRHTVFWNSSNPK